MNKIINNLFMAWDEYVNNNFTNVGYSGEVSEKQKKMVNKFVVKMRELVLKETVKINKVK